MKVKHRTHCNEYDEMDMSIYTETEEETVELREM